jgi:hypothetical protein
MTRIRSFASIAAVALLIAVPMFGQARGSANFTTFVAVGDSYGAGYESSSLNERHQVFSWPAIIAKQVGLTICPTTAAATDHCFAVPLISYPGLGPELILLPTGPVPGTGSGAPRMAGFGRPYNNLSVPGYTIAAALALTGTEANSGLGQVILRGLGNEVDQALSLHPTFIGVWLGGNDFLGAVSSGTPTLLTPSDTFKTQYNALLDKLVAGASGAGMVVGTLPSNFASNPFTGMLPSVVFDSNFQPVVVSGSTFPLIYLPAGATTPAAVPPGSIVLLSALPKYQTGFGIPPQLAAFPPFNALPNAGKPLTDADIITPTEKATFEARIADYNSTIVAAAGARNIPVADIKGLFDRYASPTGVTYGPFTFTNTYVRGGLFSLDGVHPTDIGYVLFANEFIKAINTGYGTHIPLANIAQFLENNDPALQSSFGGLSLSAEAARQILDSLTAIYAPEPPPPIRRRSGH